MKKFVALYLAPASAIAQMKEQMKALTPEQMKPRCPGHKRGEDAPMSRDRFALRRWAIPGHARDKAGSTARPQKTGTPRRSTSG